MADGWAVQVTRRVTGGGESKQTYYAHIPDRGAAERAVANRVCATSGVRVMATAKVPHNAFAGMNVPEGEVSQWA